MEVITLTCGAQLRCRLINGVWHAFLLTPCCRSPFVKKASLDQVELLCISCLRSYVKQFEPVLIDPTPPLLLPYLELHCSPLEAMFQAHAASVRLRDLSC